MHIYKDPLADYKITALSDLFEPLARKLGYRTLTDHVHEVLFAYIFYDAIYRLSGAISPSISKAYRSLNHRTQINYDIHVTSMVNCLLLLTISFPLFNDPVLSLDKVSSYTPYAGYVTAVSCGYFLWDSVICLRYIRSFGPGFAVHGVAALFVFAQSFRPYILFYAPHFLMFELSTPFLNVHWFATHLPAGLVPSWIVTINGLFLMLTFFSARIAWGFYQAFYFALEVFSTKNLKVVPLWLPVTIVASNVLLNILNIYWFNKMVRLATKRFSGSKEHKE
jgi:hypothetical protein